MPINCPASGNSVTVTVTGGMGTICVRGDIVSQGAVVIDVKVLEGHAHDIGITVPSGTTSATITGQTFCAVNVPVPALGVDGTALPGKKLTAVAWQSAAGTVERIMVQQFHGVNAGLGGIDCCIGCGSPPMASTAFLTVTSELPPNANLEVTIPDGKDGGRYQATATAHH